MDELSCFAICRKDMEKSRIPFLEYLFIVLILLHVTMGDPRTQRVELLCGNQSEYNFTASPAYVSNFISSMGNVSQQIGTQGYGFAGAGSGIDAIYGFAQCYGDLSLQDCVLCYGEARTLLPQCFPVNGARIFLDGCFMRSDNFSFFQDYTGPQDKAICGNETRKSQAFEQIASSAILQAVSNAMINNSYGRVEVPADPRTTNESVYVLADCWKTLNASSCRACFQNASNSLLGCLPWSEGRAVNTGCFMRYSDTNFLNPIPGSSESRGTLIIVIVVVASIAVVLAGAAIGVYFWKQKKIENKRKGPNDAKKLAKILNDRSLHFKYSTLDKATDGFDEANKLGEGGSGTVYQGTLQDGREIAVKRFFDNNKHRAADFYHEVNIISTLEHKNLVRLLGCSYSGPESLLVYEFLPNMSLDKFIFDSYKGEDLNWEKRFEIIIGIAEGLVYLHENSKTRIIHRDIKASNILLDARLRAKIADFGLARSLQEDKSHISTAIAGTLGYMAPEYLAHGQLTEKIDVYSFGVLVLEIVTGKQNNKSETSKYSENLVNTAWMHFQQRTVDELYDPNLTLHNYHIINITNEVHRVVHVGLLCTQETPSLRPSMSKALQMLVKKEENLPVPTNPPFLDAGPMESKT